MTLDINGTRFHLLLTENDWAVQPAAGSDLVWRDGTLRLRQLLSVYPRRESEQALKIEQRRGAACDRYANWYWISDDENEILVQPRARRHGSHFWAPDDALCSEESADRGDFAPVAPGTPRAQLRGLALTRDHYLVVGMTNPAGLLVFDLHGGGPPLTLTWPDETPFAPFDMVAAKAGGLFILDCDNRAIWQIDRHFRVVRAGAARPQSETDFRPLGPEVAAAASGPVLTPVDAASAYRLDEPADPIAIEALPDGSVLILDAGGSGTDAAVHRYRLSGLQGTSGWLGLVVLDEAVRGTLEENDADTLLPVRAHDFAFKAKLNPQTGKIERTVWIVGPDGNQALAFEPEYDDDGLRLTLQTSAFPMRLFGGRALVAGCGDVRYDQGDRLVSLVRQPRARFVGEAVLQLPGTDAFDGHEHDCVWHRLLIDAHIPAGCTVVAKSRAANTHEALEAGQWEAETPLYRRSDGSEIPYYHPPFARETDRTGTWELLFQNARGRYLQLHLTIKGTGRDTPRLYALRVHYPRFSYLKEYLPSLYQDEPISAHFLDRYLANIEGLYTTLEGRIADVQTLFDVRTVPPDYIEWLAGWLDAQLDTAWSDGKKRLFLSHAPQLYAERGTCAGIVRMVRLSLNECADDSIFTDAPCTYGESPGFGVRVIERFRTRQAPGVVFGDASEVVGPGVTTSLSTWSPEHGSDPIHEGWRAYLEERYADIERLNDAWETDFSGFEDPDLRFPAIRPSGGERQSDWAWFTRRHLSFLYATVTDDDEEDYREFLARRYAQPQDLNTEYGLRPEAGLVTFEDVRPQLWEGMLRDSLPAAGPWLRDWVLFVSLVLPLKRRSYRFSVLIPVQPAESRQQMIEKRELARRIVDREKPAHTTFDVKLYYALCRVGEARVGLDTIVGESSRSVAILLDGDVLGAGHLGFVPPHNIRDRVIMGREHGIGMV